jgi:SAM-dependent methyltransferase
MTSDHVRKNRAGWNADSDAYQARNSPQLDHKPLAWGVWALPERELGVLGEIAGKRVLELGCGAAQWAHFLAERGARVVGLDLSERQLRHARERWARRPELDVALVHGDAEQLPFASAAFDVVFCDHGAMTFADPRRTVPEVARVLRPGGLFAFNNSSPLRDLCYDPARDALGDRLHGDYFALHRIDDEDGATFQLQYGEWIRLFVCSGFEIEDLIEPRPPVDGTTTYEGYVSLEWARRFPAEHIWKLRRRV